MNTRTHVWLAALVLAGLLASAGPARADRLPSRLQDHVVLDSDPWRPDTKDPGRALKDLGESVLDERGGTPAVREPASRQTWSRFLLRILRFRYSWGIWR